MARPKGSASAMGDIPEGPLAEILSGVPVKSVYRFKCVSSAWRDLIADPHYRKKLAQAMSGLFCMTPATSEAAAAGDANAESSYGFSFVDLSHLTAGSADLDVDPRFSFLTELPEMKVLLFRDSCNGLVLFEHREEPRSGRLGYIVCNPTTKEWETVPNCGSATLLTYPYLAFDPKVSSHFNLLQFQVYDDQKFLSVHAYSSEAGSWSANQVDKQGWRCVRFNLADPTPGPFVNGFLHLLVWQRDELRIVAVDMQCKARKLIQVPHAGDDRFWMCYFGESQGQLYYMAQEMLGARQEERYKMSVWALQDYGAQKWVLKGTVNSHEVFGAENGGEGGKIEFEVVDIHQNRNMIFLTHPLENKLVAYDMNHEQVSTLATFDEHKELMGTARYVQCYSNTNPREDALKV